MAQPVTPVYVPIAQRRGVSIPNPIFPHRSPGINIAQRRGLQISPMSAPVLSLPNMKTASLPTLQSPTPSPILNDVDTIPQPNMHNLIGLQEDDDHHENTIPGVKVKSKILSLIEYF